MTLKRTPWISCKTPPLKSRPGEYEVRCHVRTGHESRSAWCPVHKILWTGTDWYRIDDFGYFPWTIYGDEWRGVAQA